MNDLLAVFTILEIDGDRVRVVMAGKGTGEQEFWLELGESLPLYGAETYADLPGANLLQ